MDSTSEHYTQLSVISDYPFPHCNFWAHSNVFTLYPSPMPSQRNTERILGILYLTFMASSIAGFAVSQVYLGRPDYLLSLYESRQVVSLGVLLHLVNDASVVAIGILMFGLFRKANTSVATTILTTRIMEATLLMVGKVGLLLLLTVSKEYVAAGGTETYYLTLGTLLKKWNNWSFEMAMLALGIGGFVLNYFLWSRKLIPSLLAILGMVGYVLLFSKSVLAISGYTLPFYFFLPVALFEVTFPFWLLIKGFRGKME